MKKHFISMVLACALVCFGAGMSLAGQGKGPGDGTGPVHDLLSGIPFSYEGDVIGYAQDGSLIITTDDGDVQLYGVGPVYYWESQEVAYPVIDDTLIASGFIVDYNGVEKNVVMSIAIDDVTILLRDPETGKPLWRGSNGESAGSGSCNPAAHAGSGGSASSCASKGGAYK